MIDVVSLSAALATQYPFLKASVSVVVMPSFGFGHVIVVVALPLKSIWIVNVFSGIAMIS